MWENPDFSNVCVVAMEGQGVDVQHFAPNGETLFHRRFCRGMESTHFFASTCETVALCFTTLYDVVLPFPVWEGSKKQAEDYEAEYVLLVTHGSWRDLRCIFLQATEAVTAVCLDDVDIPIVATTKGRLLSWTRGVWKYAYNIVGDEEENLPCTNDRITSLHAAEDDRIVSGHFSGTIRILFQSDEMPCLTIKDAHKSFVKFLSVQNNLLVSAGSAGTVVKMWDMDTMELVWKWTNAPQATCIQGLHLTHDGFCVVGCLDEDSDAFLAITELDTISNEPLNESVVLLGHCSDEGFTMRVWENQVFVLPKHWGCLVIVDIHNHSIIHTDRLYSQVDDFCLTSPSTFEEREVDAEEEEKESCWDTYT